MNSMPERLFWVTCAVAVALLGVHLVRRRGDIGALRENNDFAAFMYQMFGLVYGVYLAFTIIAVWEQFSTAEEVATAEATHLSELWRDAEPLGDRDRNTIHERLLAYIDSVVADEWETMASTHGPAPRTSGIYEDLWKAYYAVQLDPSKPVQMAFFQETLGRLNDLGMLRRRRLLVADSALPPLMWMLLLGGGLITVGFAFLFGTTHAATQYLVTGAVTAMVAFSIMMVASMQFPFSGDVSVQPDAYQSVADSMRARALASRTPLP